MIVVAIARKVLAQLVLESLGSATCGCLHPLPALGLCGARHVDLGGRDHITSLVVRVGELGLYLTLVGLRTTIVSIDHSPVGL